MANVVLNLIHHPWLPLNASEVGLALGVGSLGAALAHYAGIAGDTVAVGCAVYLALTYFAALLAQAGSRPRDLTFLANGGVAGSGYLDVFRSADQSLLLMHVDDDVPNPELQGLYASLLQRGVQIRRIILLRPDHDAEGYRWIAEFGSHDGLRQRAIASTAASVMPFSFAVVDERVVLVAVPGFHVTDTEPYAERLIFRHLLVLNRGEVTRAFLEMYEALWLKAEPIVAENLPLEIGSAAVERQRRPRRLSTC